MTAVQQSGNPTPGHVALWTAPGVIGDGGALGAAQKVLALITDADFNDTNDQPILLPERMQALMLTAILITIAGVSLTIAVGGLYPAASKAGTAIVAASQVYTALTTANKILSATLAGTAGSTRFSRTELADWAIYLSLTTAQGAAATADVYLIGIDLT